jgi:Nuclear pore protein 84 / 107
VAGHLNAVKALAERVLCSHLIRPDELNPDDENIEGELGQRALEYAQHSALWELFASFDRWEEFALQYMNAHYTRRDRLAEKQFKNDAKAALSDFMTRAKTMVLSDDGLNSCLDDVVRLEDPETYLTLSRIRDLYVPEIILRMHEVFLWGGENIDPTYFGFHVREVLMIGIWTNVLTCLRRWQIQAPSCTTRSARRISWKITLGKSKI